MKKTGLNLRETLRSGFHLKEEEIRECEDSLLGFPDSLEVRVRLLGCFWFNKQWELALPHLMWMIETDPECQVLEWEAATIGDLSGDPVIVDALKSAWEKKLKQNPANPKVLANAAAFFLVTNRSRSIKLLEDALKVEPDNSENLKKLSQTYELEMEENVKSSHLKRALEVQKMIVADDEDNVGKMTVLAFLHLYANEMDEAKRLADKAKELITKDASDEITAKLHCVRGLIHLQKGSASLAKEELMEMGTFPVFSLANNLIQAGHLDIVQDYLKKLLDEEKIGKLQYTKWIAMLKIGKKPKLEI